MVTDGPQQDDVWRESDNNVVGYGRGNGQQPSVLPVEEEDSLEMRLGKVRLNEVRKRLEGDEYVRS